MWTEPGGISSCWRSACSLWLPSILQKDWAFLPQKVSACRNLENPSVLGVSCTLYLEVHIADRFLFCTDD